MSARVWFRTGWVCPCILETFPLIEQEMILRGLIKESIDVYQWSYHPGFGPSAGSHDEGGTLDAGQCSDAHLRIWRLWGYETQRRTRAQGFDVEHGHAVVKGCPHRSPMADGQARSWENGRNGLASNGPITGPGPIGKDTPTWKQALKTRRPIVASLKDEIAAEVVRQLRKEYRAIADAVLERDAIPNTFTGNEANETVSLKTALSYLSKHDTEILSRLPKGNA